MYVELSVEDREGSDDTLQNEDQTLYAAQHILYNDIRHTCQFAVTIEGSSVRLWYHTRSRTIFTERFDMHKVRKAVLTSPPALLMTL